MSEALKQFMVNLASDIGGLSRFIANPQTVATEAGLSQEDRDILFSGDQNRIYAALAGIEPPKPQETPPAPAEAAAEGQPSAATPVVAGQWPGVIVYVYPPLITAAMPQEQSAAWPQFYPTYGWGQVNPAALVSPFYAASQPSIPPVAWNMASVPMMMFVQAGQGAASQAVAQLAPVTVPEATSQQEETKAKAKPKRKVRAKKPTKKPQQEGVEPKS
jgi:hypothetical protein